MVLKTLTENFEKIKGVLQEHGGGSQYATLQELKTAALKALIKFKGIPKGDLVKDTDSKGSHLFIISSRSFNMSILFLK